MAALDPEKGHYSQALVAATQVISENGMAVTMSVEQEQLEYLETNEIIRSTRQIIQVESFSAHTYPKGSLEFSMLKNPHTLKEIENGNFTWYPNFVTPDARKISERHALPLGNIHPNSIENAEEVSLLVNSKSWLRDKAERYGFDIPEGKVLRNASEITSFNDFYTIVHTLVDETLEKHNLPTNGSAKENVQVWIKYNSLSGGEGVQRLQSLSKEGMAKTLRSFISIAENLHLDIGNGNDASKLAKIIKDYCPITLEVGADTLENEETIGNINIQGIIGDGNDLRQLRITDQATSENGDYLGNKFPFEMPEGEKKIRDSFAQICSAARDEGYRGIIGADAMITKSPNGEIHVRWFDTNGRANGSTPLQEHAIMLHNINHKTQWTGINTKLIFNQEVTFTQMEQILGDLLWRREEFDRPGIIPIALRTQIGENVSFMSPIVKVSLIAPTRQDLQQLLEDIRKKEIVL
jgi:hypothetical protein